MNAPTLKGALIFNDLLPEFIPTKSGGRGN
jgi:hypothetical protein